MKKKLIEVALPLDAINEASAREKSIRHGHPSTLHLWWARRPLAAARAVIFSSLVDDPSSHPDKFPTVEEQNKERKRLFEILEKLVVWENSNNERILSLAKKEILKSTNGNPPELLDPFAGGGAIPLEGQRLGLKVHAGDLNPVAVMINKAMIEIPPKFQGLPPVNPSYNELEGIDAKGHLGLAADVEYYANWMRDEAFKRIGHLYPTEKLSDGTEVTIIAWIWARTVMCPNPVCRIDMPLARSFTLSSKKGNEHHVRLDVSGTKIKYSVESGVAKYLEGTVNRRGAICPKCLTPVDFKYIRDKGKAKKMSSVLIAKVANTKSGRMYMNTDENDSLIANVDLPENLDTTNLPERALGFRVQAYGMTTHQDLFTSRQLIALTTFSNLVQEAQDQAYSDARKSGILDDNISLSNGGCGAKAYGEAIGVYLAFLVDKITDYNSSFCSWITTLQAIRNTFARQAIPMVWDYAEANPLGDSAGSFISMLSWLVKVIIEFPKNTLPGVANQADATIDNNLRSMMISTDPPYYDNIGYADLSDFFYVWLRRSLKNTYPDIFKTMLVPKTEELIATPFRFKGSTKKAEKFFEDGMLQAFKQIHRSTQGDIPMTVFYAFKQAETTRTSRTVSGTKTVSTGWDTMLTALIQAGFMITGTWPMRTERGVRSVAIGSNALASSIVLVCRKRSSNSPTISRREFVASLRLELKNALKKLQEANIAPVDLAQASIGPGMAIFSRNKEILEADGKPMTVESALQEINAEIDLFFNEQEGDLDSESRFCVDLFSQFAYNPVKYGIAETLASAKGIAIPSLENKNILSASKGIVQLFEREELNGFSSFHASNVWVTTQQLAFSLEQKGISGAASILNRLGSALAENVKALAYRLYTISERKGWAKEALAYNNLVTSWSGIQLAASQLQEGYSPGELQFE